ncbi:3-dehydroquinate synthase [Mucilaginibacter sp. BJC16-A38]|uniref:3-dehydroquinate synthase n=1 Tax=Mucilaginibacter phenanthrenivorans TaxID=1234842 RepID=UPI002157879A|nr:3-dehydroquinate synthase [Mucilaginibacter phenanthrenivorans]MCR8561234.1 3-dehydroquinate synthase [Mucilaginibacter phenanthrenivorans]
MKTIQSDTYPIFFEDSIAELEKFIKAGNYSRSFILTDENTSVHCMPLIQAQFEGHENFDIIEVNAGEESKTIDFCIGIWKMLIDFEADRKALLVNLGGGVITDMGGFAASTFKRGIDFVHIPTTLLSQVDASVGGKTGIDLDNVKNIIGTFTMPKAVFISNDFLKTLPERQVLSGVAEMLKHGLIMDAAYWEALKNSDLSAPSAELIYRSVEIKNDVVTEDPKEHGIRKALNFGHTIGHAVETNSLINDKNPLTHGEAIALGMICEAYLSHKKAGLSSEDLNEIVKVIGDLYPKYSLANANFETLCSIMLKDKKNQNGKINCTLLTSIGQCSLDNICTDAELCESLSYYANL